MKHRNNIKTQRFLSRVTEVSLHSSLLDSGAVGRHRSHLDPAGENLEIRDGVEDPKKVWGDSKPCIEVKTFPPGGSAGTGPERDGTISLHL